jgi:hypothetical protein
MLLVSEQNSNEPKAMAGHVPGASQFVASMIGWATGTVLGVLIAAGASLAVTSLARQHAAPSPRDSRPTSRPAEGRQNRLPPASTPAGASEPTLPDD